MEDIEEDLHDMADDSYTDMTEMEADSYFDMAEEEDLYIDMADIVLEVEDEHYSTPTPPPRSTYLQASLWTAVNKIKMQQYNLQIIVGIIFIWLLSLTTLLMYIYYQHIIKVGVSVLIRDLHKT